MEIRLLPIVMISASALLSLKVLGLAMGETMLTNIAHTSVAYAAEGTPAAGDEPAMDAPADGSAPAAAAPPDAGMEQAADGTGGAAPLPPNVSTTRPEEVQFEESTSETKLLEHLSERRDELSQQEEQMKMRSKLLEAAETRLNDRVEKLKELETKINVSAEMKKAEDAAKLKGLVTMYEAMKPKDAARVFDGLSFEVLLPLVDQMNPRKMSAILAQMKPEIAARMTTAIALRGTDQDVGPTNSIPDQPATPVDELPKIGPAAQ
ncbi:flagellar protein FlbB [Hartmannibacter diazotrophicus]|uniref:Flagellar protein FlbB n=1 Tax=Hartmannibacter diazotrophicus TaxID=1482074 RepID=A0A2C9D907_9HYPH|nr:hypothetical protein [Hartmannibacter diazotrophicus]SON56211.1 flagellar protein FlbB [Hartmannibacter diazotrophicus]